MALDAAGRGLGTVAALCSARLPPGEPETNSAAVLLGGIFTSRRAGYLMSRMCIPAR